MFRLTSVRNCIGSIIKGRSLATLEKNASGVATLWLDHGAANALNTDFLQSICSSISTATNDKDIKGMIIASKNSKIFSAGLGIIF